MTTDPKNARRNQRKQQNRIRDKLLASGTHCFQSYKQWQEIFRGWKGCDFTFHDMDLEMQRRGFSKEKITDEIRKARYRRRYAREVYITDSAIDKNYHPRIKPVTKPEVGSTSEAMSEDERTLDRYKCYKTIQEESLAAGEITPEQRDQYLANYRGEHNIIVDT